MSLHDEIHEQPDCLRRLFRTQRKAAEEIARTVRPKDIRFVFVAARGTSENAARYASYLWGMMNGLPIAHARPSLFTYYNRPPQLRGAFVVGISQSGRSPDIVSVLAEAKRQGCYTLAITNAVKSPLAQTADFVLDIQAGDELAVAATKTYSTELMAVAMLSAALRGEECNWKQLEKVPDWVEMALQEDATIGMKVQAYRKVSSCVVLGRGFSFATAYEWALKLKELTYVEAQPYSSADFQHGPIAIVDGGFPILAVVPGGAVYTSTIEVLRNLRDNRSADLVIISDQNGALKLAKTGLRLPADVPESLSPLVSIVPAQLFSYHLALAKGCNTETPRGIHKVTETR